MRLGFFGGSFNPPHVAHLLAVTYVLATEDVDGVLVVPCYQHPFAKELAPFEDRFAMCELAMGWLPRVTISRVEQELGGESRTLRTVEHWLATHPGDSLRLVIGTDVLLEGPRWQGFEQISKLAPPIVLGRQGVDPKVTTPVTLPEISSTDVRLAIAEGRREDVAAAVPRAVIEYIELHGMYRV
jgi:nicotinate-nucleotide adenylyltransferase